MMYGHGAMTEHELDEKYPQRPHIHSKTLPFHELLFTLFNPLNDNKKKPTGPTVARKKIGPHGTRTAPHDIRRQIIVKFISRWRKDVGNDIYPALRLITPEKDRDRGMYGLKELTLGKILVKVMKIDKNSDDAYTLLHWKLPGAKSSSTMAGDFAGRCYEVISKRPMRTSPGDMSIAEVNELLDRLSVAQKEENQRPIIEEFYKRMNAEELMWLIRMILRQMKIGATEKTIFDLWHPDAENLFNISSSLRRVCWELYDPSFRLEGENCGINLMQCFQPQLAAFQMRSLDKAVARMNPTEEDPHFWIEDKLDGERMQLHMTEDTEIPGGMRFSFWSRKAKDYTYLYGESFEDDKASLTRHLRDAFNDGVRNMILDGEMITWDPLLDKMVPFGHLKTAALSEQEDPYGGTGTRPLFRVFDCLYLNDVILTKYTLRNRYEALKKSIKSVHRRLEIHEHTDGKAAADIEPILRQVIADGAEGLVLKNPRSEYRLNERNDDWIKVKPEYMTEFGEELDCVVIGGFYGSGKRGGGLSSFLCGLRVDQPQVDSGADPRKCYSFFKVGGGFTASDYAEIRHRTDGKWTDWDPRNPPLHLIELGGGDRQIERPDVWIEPDKSVVLSVKAASVTATTDYRTGKTLRFPRFKKLRADKNWKSALSVQGFEALRRQAEEEREERSFKVDDARRKRNAKVKKKKKIVVQGQEEEITTAYAGPVTEVFQGLKFYVMTESLKPNKKSKAEVEQIIKGNGGTVVASKKDEGTIIVADRNLVKVASLQKSDQRTIVRPSWVFDCVKQGEIDVRRPSFLLPVEPRHLFYVKTEENRRYDDNVDKFGDSYARDVTNEELAALFKSMPDAKSPPCDPSELMDQFAKHGHDLDKLPGWMFRSLRFYFHEIDQSARDAKTLVRFAGGVVADALAEGYVTHIVCTAGTVREVREGLVTRARQPRIVDVEWVRQCWSEKTRLDEERHAL